MSRGASVNISLSSSMRSYVKRRMGKGGFDNLSDYFRHLVREDQRIEAERKEAEKELAAMILEGLDSGPPEELTPQWLADRKAAVKRSLRRGRSQ